MYYFSLKKELDLLTIYTTTMCAYCNMVKQFLDNKGVKYNTINIEELPEYQEEVERISGGTAVPVITNGESVVVGWNRLKLMELI